VQHPRATTDEQPNRRKPGSAAWRGYPHATSPSHHGMSNLTGENGSTTRRETPHAASPSHYGMSNLTRENPVLATR